MGKYFRLKCDAINSNYFISTPPFITHILNGIWRLINTTDTDTASTH